MDRISSTLVFYVNGKKIAENNPNPEWTLLYYLRYKLGLCGTKEGCGEGGCGACTVLLSKYDDTNDHIVNSAINACLMPLCSLHGCAIVTVEGIGSVRTKVHPVQERIAKSHGTQCGFCTPGFVMSMYALLRNNPNPTEKELENAFQGNLCRCTGYRPILSGFQTLCCKGETSNGVCCMDKPNDDLQLADTIYDPSEFIPYDPDTQDVVFPPGLRSNAELYKQSLLFWNRDLVFYRPASLSELMELKSKFPKAKILAGNTELGLEAKFKSQLPPVYIQSSVISELNQIKIEKNGEIMIGAGVTLSELQKFCQGQNARTGSVFEALAEMIHWFAGPQIRNVATIAGNIITASPIADLNPIFIAADADVLFESNHGSRTMRLDSDFFKAYRTTEIQENEILRSLRIPSTKNNEYIWATKQCRRREDDISIVNAAMKVEFEDNTCKVKNAVLVYGGMAPVTKIASKASNFLIGKKWSHEILEQISALLIQDFPLSVDVPGGMPLYRQSLTTSLFYKFYLLVSDWLSLNTKAQCSESEARNKSAIRPCFQPATKESQLHQIVSNTQPTYDLVGRPVLHLSGLKHATGEAVYVDDIPISANELFGAFVINRKVSFGKILKIDATAALATPGVVTYIDSRDWPKNGKRTFGQFVADEFVFPVDEVQAIGQTIGLIVAKDQITAEKAANLVQIEIEAAKTPILTIEDAIAQKSYFGHRHLQNGDVNSVFAKSEHILEGEMRVGGQEQFYLETQSVVAVPKEDDEMEIFLGTQSPVSMQRNIAACLGIPQNRITVKTRRIGGSFGGKETRCALLGISAALAAQKLRVPVRIVLNRYDDMEITGHRPPYVFRYKVGFGSDGHIHGIKMEIYLNAGHCPDLTEAIIGVTTLSLDGTFNVPIWEIDCRACKTNTQPNTAMRGFGNPEGSVVLHTIFEHIAAKLGKDSLEIRQMHMYKEGDLTPSNQLLNHCTGQQCLDQCLRNSNYEKRKIAVEEFNRANRWKKRGIAVTTTKQNLGFEAKFMNQAAALVMVHLDGSVTLNHGGMEMGQGLHTKMIQIATRVLQIPACKIYFSETATDKIPNATATCGSVSSDLNGVAVLNACEILIERLVPYKVANPSGKWEDWVSAAYYDQTSLSAIGFYKNPDVDYSFETNSGRHTNYTSFGAACSEVEIDCLTGDHTVLRTDIVMDVGESLNPAIDVGQIEGAFIQGYGLFVMEELLHSPKGHLLTRGPSMYKIPTMNDIPREFYVSILRGSSNPRAVYSSKGIGEPPLTLSTSIFFAIRNAIVGARKEQGLSTDFRFDTPATAERIRMACENEYSVNASDEKETNKKVESPWGIRL